MKAQLTIAFATLLLLAGFSALAWSGTSRVASPGKPVTGEKDWPEGTLDLINDPLRTDGWNPFFSEWPNDINDYCFKVQDTAAVNRLIEKLAAIKAPKVQVRLNPGNEVRSLGFSTVLNEGNGTAVIFSIGDQVRINEWYSHLREVEPGVREFGVSRLREVPRAMPPTLTLYVGNKAVDLKQVKVPRNIEVVADVPKSPKPEEAPQVDAINHWLKNRESSQSSPQTNAASSPNTSAKSTP